MKKKSHLDNFLNWIYIHRKPIAITLISVMILSIVLDVSLLRENGVLQRAKTQQAYVEESEKAAESEAHETDIAAHMNQFVYAIDEGDYTSALEAINYIIEHDTGDDSATADYYLKRGGTYVLMEEYDAAMKDLDVSLQFNSNQSDIYTLKAQIYMLKENYEEALNAFDQAIGLSEQSPEVYYNRAVCLVMTEKYDQALKDLEYVLQSDCEEEIKSDCQLLIDAILYNASEV